MLDEMAATTSLGRTEAMRVLAGNELEVACRRTAAKSSAGHDTVITALDMDGHVQWRAENGKGRAPARPAGARCTPTIDGARLYHENAGGQVFLTAGYGKGSVLLQIKVDGKKTSVTMISCTFMRCVRSRTFRPYEGTALPGRDHLDLHGFVPRQTALTLLTAIASDPGPLDNPTAEHLVRELERRGIGLICSWSPRSREPLLAQGLAIAVQATSAARAGHDRNPSSAFPAWLERPRETS
jgi:hypothetical protein